MNALTIAQSAAVVASAARPRVPAGRAARAVRAPLGGRSDVACVPSSSAARRRAVCRADKSDAEKTVSALDAILAGSQDEAAPEEVRARPIPSLSARGPGPSPPHIDTHHAPIQSHPTRALARRATRVFPTSDVDRPHAPSDRFADPSTPLGPRRSPPPPPPLPSVSPARCPRR